MKLQSYYKREKFKSQEDFARFLGVSPSLVCMWFKGIRPVSRKAAVNIYYKTDGKVSLRELLT